MSVPKEKRAREGGRVSCPASVRYARRGVRHCDVGESCFVADLHQREPQQIQALPQVGVIRVYVILGESDAPDAVNRAGLNDDARTGILEECIQLRVLRELGLVGPDDNCISVLQPIVLVESAHVAAKRLGRVGRRRP